MIGQAQLERLWSSLLGLGGRKLFALALMGVTVFATVGLSSYYLSRPDLEMLYGGLNAQDVSRIGAALKEAGIHFDVNSQGTAVLVRRGQSGDGWSRTLLADSEVELAACRATLSRAASFVDEHVRSVLRLILG